MKKTLVLFCAILVAIFVVSCSDDDNAPVQENNVELLGSWQLNTVQITNFVESGFPAPDACMISYVTGYVFNDDGTVLISLLENTPFANMSKPEYWTWEGDITGFTITQVNQAMPPYNFGIAATNVNVEEVNGVWTMTFSTELANGTTADFTLIKQDINGTQQPVVLNEDGSAYTCNPFGGQ